MARVPNTDKFEPQRFYHIYNHAVGDENLFRSKENYLYFLEKFKYHISPVAKVYAYCLMPNHFHFLIQIRTESELLPLNNNIETFIDYHILIIKQFRRMFSGYVQAYNKMYNRKGSLLMDNFRRKNVNNTFYFKKLVYYIHHNPVHHQFKKTMDEWEFSSYPAIPITKKTNIERETVINWFGSIEDYLAYHDEFHTDVINYFEGEL